MIVTKSDNTTVVTFENIDEIGVLALLIKDARKLRQIAEQGESILAEQVIRQLCSLVNESNMRSTVNQYIPLGRRIRSDLLKSGSKILHGIGFPEFRRLDGANRKYSITVTAENYHKWESRSEPLFSFLLYHRRDVFNQLPYQLCVSQVPELGVINCKGVITNNFVESAVRYGFKYFSRGPKALSKLYVSLSIEEYKSQLLKYTYALMDVFWDDWVFSKPSEEQMVTIIRANFGIEPMFGKSV